MLTRAEKDGLTYVLGLLEGMAGSVREDVEHYQDIAKLAAERLRETFPDDAVRIER